MISRKTFASHYQMVLAEVNSAHRKQVSMLLRWTIFAFRPLTERELSDIMDMQSQDCPPSSSKEIVQMTKGLLVMRHATSNDTQPGASGVQLAHASVRDFFFTREAGDFQMPHTAEAHKSMLDACLEMLVEGGGSQSPDLEQHPFLQYAADFWPKHLEEARKDDPGKPSFNDKTSGYLHRLFDAAAPAAFLCWLRLSDPAEPEAGVQLTKNLDDFRPMEFYLDMFNLQSLIVGSQRNSVEEEHQDNTSGSRSNARYRILCCRPH